MDHPFLQKLEEYFKNTPKEQIEKDWLNILKDTDSEAYYKRKYKDSLERMKSWVKGEHPECFCEAQKAAEFIFPELKESEDEKIRRELITHCRNTRCVTEKGAERTVKWIAWLEKQGKQPTDKSVIKFADEYSHNVWEKLMANFNNIDGYSIGCNDVSDIVLNAIIDTCNWNKTMTQEEKNLEELFQALPEKMVDEKSHQVYELCVYHYDGQCVVDYVGEIDHDSLYTFGGDTLYDAIEKAWNWLRKNSTGG